MNHLFLVVFVAAGSPAIVVTAAWLMLRVSDRDLELVARVSAARGVWVAPLRDAGERRRLLLQPAQRGLAAMGRWVLRSGLLGGRSKHDLQQALTVSGFAGRTALPIFLGIKIMLMLAVPFVMGLLGAMTGRQATTRLVMIAIGFILGLLTPDKIVHGVRKRYLARLEEGLPDALDLLVICAQAGLSLAPAMSRVATEMETARPEVARELALTVRELEILPTAAAALGNLAKRTGLPTLDRLGSTLIQTLQYGTPLTDALRNLSAEVRQQALTRFEGRAARLPVLLTLPMILFILPCVFIIAGGPAILQVAKTLGR